MKPVAGRSRFYLASLLLVTALLLGGGGAVAPLHNLLIELLALALITVTMLDAGGLDWKSRAAPLALLALILVTPIIQLIPIPFSLWSGLPGRDFAAEVGSLLGSARPWRPLSLDPEATALSGAFLLAPAALFLAGLTFDNVDRRRLVSIAVAGAFASMVLGLLQMAAGDAALHLYRSAHSYLPTGFFSNRNHQADLLLIAIPLGAALLAQRIDRHHLPLLLLFGLLLGLSAGVIATASRTAFLLMPIAVVGGLAIFPRAAFARHRGTLIGAAAVAAVAVTLVAVSGGTQQVMGRFGNDTDLRVGYWQDAYYAATLYFPWGSGLGTFDPVYRAIENLNQLGALYANHAHNDYLELLVETGLWGMLLTLAGMVLLGYQALRRLPADLAPFRRAAALAILIILLHSFVDYPLRMLSLLTLFGLLCALLYPPLSRGASSNR